MIIVGVRLPWWLALPVGLVYVSLWTCFMVGAGLVWLALEAAERVARWRGWIVAGLLVALLAPPAASGAPASRLSVHRARVASLAYARTVGPRASVERCQRRGLRRVVCEVRVTDLVEDGAVDVVEFPVTIDRAPGGRVRAWALLFAD